MPALLLTALLALAAAPDARPAADGPMSVAQTYDCAKKTCKQMRTCAEACYKFRVCGMTRLDRDKDGIPCENICSRRCAD